jgi:transcription initiation factor IIE alpha subunit
MNRRKRMPINQTETNLHAITVTIAYLEKQEGTDEELLKKLKNERTSLLKKLRVIE